MRKLVMVFTLFLVVAAIGVAQDTTPVVIPTWDDIEAGVWTNIPGPEGTICSNGTPYSFFARPASEPSDKLLIHFQGGGACWMQGNCDLTANPTYDPFVDESDDPTNGSGIFDFTNPANPFADYNMVLAPYCTGDVHVGDSQTTYEGGESEVTINHNGYDNAAAVLGWVFANVPTASDVFVTGCSAGAIPSPFYVWWVAENYGDARIVQLGDAAGAYRNVTGVLTDVMGSWGTFEVLGELYSDVSDADMTFEQFYIKMGNLFPEVQFAQYNAAYDQVQTGFVVLAGLGEPNLPQLLADNLADIKAGLEQDNFHSFTAGGSGHCVTVTPELYTIASNGVPLIDWVTALASGEPVDDVVCEDCTEPEVVGADE